MDGGRDRRMEDVAVTAGSEGSKSPELALKSSLFFIQFTQILKKKGKKKYTLLKLLQW